MPWSPSDAKAKTRKANSPAKQRQWAEVANAILARTGDEERAIRGANKQVAEHPTKMSLAEMMRRHSAGGAKRRAKK